MVLGLQELPFYTYWCLTYYLCTIVSSLFLRLLKLSLLLSFRINWAGCVIIVWITKSLAWTWVNLFLFVFPQGYLFISVLVNTNSDLIKLIVQSIKNDLSSRNPVHVNLALQCIANIGSKEMADAFGNDIPKLLVSGWVTLPELVLWSAGQR